MNIMSLPKVEHAVRMVRTYLVDCAENKAWNDRRTTELNEVIRSCVERMAVNRCEAQLPLEAFRHAIGYVDEHLAAVDKTWTKRGAIPDDSASCRA